MGVSPTIFILLAFALVGVTYGRRSNLRTTNTDVRYGRWNRTGLPYCIDTSFTAAQTQMIQAAVGVVMADLNYCVAWTPVPCSSPVYKVRFTSVTAGPGSAPQMYCFSAPGVDLNLKGSTSEQIISLATGPTGCWDGTLHSLMKPMAIVMGKRNEHQRGDRDSYITMQNANVAVPSAYTMYPNDNSQAYWKFFPYDYCSITHNQPTDFANPGTTAFTVAGPMATMSFIPKLDHLSNTDCQLLSMMYGCDKSACAQPSCAIQATQTGSGSATTMATTLMTTPSNLPCCPQSGMTGMTTMATAGSTGSTGSTVTGTTGTTATASTGSTGTTATGMTTTMPGGATPACVQCVCTPVGGSG